MAGRIITNLLILANIKFLFGHFKSSFICHIAKFCTDMGYINESRVALLYDSNSSVEVSLVVWCFGFHAPLRQYFSLYRAVSQREGERKEKR